MSETKKMKEMEMAATNYDLDLPFNNAYANTLNILMMRFQTLAEHRYKIGTHFRDSVFALMTLLSQLPPTGKAYMAARYNILEGFNSQKVYEYLSNNATNVEEVYEALDELFNYAQAWIWPNILALHLNSGKPAYGTDSHLGNKPR
jgi:hypothetical protein